MDESTGELFSGSMGSPDIVQNLDDTLSVVDVDGLEERCRQQAVANLLHLLRGAHRYRQITQNPGSQVQLLEPAEGKCDLVIHDRFEPLAIDDEMSGIGRSAAEHERVGA